MFGVALPGTVIRYTLVLYCVCPSCHVTVVCPLADSYVASAAREAGSVAELAAFKKMDKYTSLAANYHF